MIDYKRYLAFFCIKNLFFSVISQSFLYPIEYDSKNNLLYIFYQKSIYEVSLWFWNFETKTLQKALISNYSPASIRVLPENKAFSFIDQSKIRIKYFHKRSIKSIDFFEPICDINLIQWLDEQNFYFAARKNKNFIIYTSNIKETKLKTIIQKEGIDCIYPQILSDFIFYIEKEFKGDFINYKIIRKALRNNNEEIILNNSNPIAFLFVNSKDEIFYIEHPHKIDREDKTINFTYHHIYIKNKQLWEDETIFKFELPLAYIFGSNEERLYESMIPFIPKHYSKKIFFSSLDIDTNSMDIYSYDILQKKLERKTSALQNQMLFSPVFFKDKYYYGFLIQNKNINVKSMLFDLLFSFPD